MRRPSLRRVPIVLCVLLVALGGAFLLLRDSSMFAVREVAVRGASGPDAPKVESALRQAARGMTTLAVDTGELRRAVEAYPTVKGVEVDRSLPHGMTVTVVEKRPVAVVVRGGKRVPVAADGRLLQGATPPDDLPALDVPAVRGSRISDARGRKLVAFAAAAPEALRRRGERALIGGKGLEMELDRGPELYFGTPDQLPDKWQAVARVLADPSAEGATYIDVRVPERAAAGGLAPLVDPEDPSAVPGQTPVAPAPEPEVPAEPVVPVSPSTGA